jgi:hypothetical protein
MFNFTVCKRFISPGCLPPTTYLHRHLYTGGKLLYATVSLFTMLSDVVLDTSYHKFSWPVQDGRYPSFKLKEIHPSYHVEIVTEFLSQCIKKSTSCNIGWRPDLKTRCTFEWPMARCTSYPYRSNRGESRQMRLSRQIPDKTAACPNIFGARLTGFWEFEGSWDDMLCEKD